MCGIAGKLRAGGPVDPALIEEMCRVLEHRGPDSRGTFLEDGVGLGVQRLAVIDPHGGDQPIENEDGSVVVVLNGEVYNYLELRADLARRGHRFATASDTEVIVHLYEDHGDDCVHHLRGMFSFALWDRQRRRLLIARDRLGKKPLAYSKKGDTLWFASEAKAILQDPAVPRAIDPVAVDTFLRLQYIPHPRTGFAALRKLPPAHLLTWEDGDLRVRRYWKLSYRPRLAGVGEPELHALIRDRLLEATRLRLRSDVPLGVLLSGGVDSSSVVAAVARTSEERIKTFSVGFDLMRYDETPYAREVARLYDTEHHEIQIGPSSVDVLPEIVWHHDEPFADRSAVATFHLARLAREHVTVALSGEGGDESFAGYHRYHQLLRWGWPPRRRHFRRRDEEEGARVIARYARLVSYDFFDDVRRARLSEGGESGWTAVLAGPYAESDAPDVLGRILDVDTQTYLPADILTKVDVASMAHSLEVRTPLLDHLFMQDVAAIPTPTKAERSATKRLFRDAMRGWLPDRILDRPKQGFGIPLCEWFRGALRNLPGDVLLDPRSIERGLFRRDAVETLIDDHMVGAADNSGRIWALMQLELWLRAYVDPQRVESPPALAVS